LLSEPILEVGLVLDKHVPSLDLFLVLSDLVRVVNISELAHIKLLPSVLEPLLELLLGCITRHVAGHDAVLGGGLDSRDFLLFFLNSSLHVIHNEQRDRQESQEEDEVAVVDPDGVVEAVLDAQR